MCCSSPDGSMFFDACVLKNGALDSMFSWFVQPVDHPHGGGNHQHVGHATTVRRDSAPGKKVRCIRPECFLSRTVRTVPTLLRFDCGLVLFRSVSSLPAVLAVSAVRRLRRPWRPSPARNRCLEIRESRCVSTFAGFGSLLLALFGANTNDPWWDTTAPHLIRFCSVRRSMAVQWGSGVGAAAPGPFGARAESPCWDRAGP